MTPQFASAPTPFSATSLQEIQPLRGLGRADCDFYHKLDLPGIGITPGAWDLREHGVAYLGHLQLADKSVFEIGPASGYLTFLMESQGATVMCLEPDIRYFWDLVPNSDLATSESLLAFQTHIARIRNGFWLAHEALGSRARMFHGSAYALPNNFGPFDVSLLGSILLHTKLPLQIISQCAEVTREAIVITERWYPELGDRPVMELELHPSKPNVDTWWRFTPRFFQHALAVFGFPNSRVDYHQQQYLAAGAPATLDLFTVVATR